MIKELKYKTSGGVCSREMTFQYDDETMTLISFSVIGGCNGNLKGIKALIEGEKIETIVEKLSGIRCGFRSSSCPDQVAKALKTLL